jgi:hypothetical protein
MEKKIMRNTGLEFSYLSVYAIVGRSSLNDSSVQGHESLKISY